VAEFVRRPTTEAGGDGEAGERPASGRCGVYDETGNVRPRLGDGGSSVHVMGERSSRAARLTSRRVDIDLDP